jgi:hypothetical protein
MREPVVGALRGVCVFAIGVGHVTAFDPRPLRVHVPVHC